jgi:hypothetical protein
VTNGKPSFDIEIGLYEFLVLPFGLTNTAASFQDMMNHILKDFLDNGVIEYIDDIRIYTKNEDIHDKLVKEVLERLAKNDLVISPEKCFWGEKDVELLGYILTLQGMRMGKDKTKAIQESQPLKSLKDV